MNVQNCEKIPPDLRPIASRDSNSTLKRQQTYEHFPQINTKFSRCFSHSMQQETHLKTVRYD